MDLTVTTTGSVAELCGDRRTVPSLGHGLYLHTGDTISIEDDPDLHEANTRPPMPQIIPLTFGAGTHAVTLFKGFVGRTPPEALDRSALVPPASSGPMSLADLGALADRFGVFVQVYADRLATDRGELPLAEHRVVPLAADGRTTTLDAAAMVRVVPAAGRAAGAYEVVHPEAARIIAEADQPDLWGRIVFGPDGVVLGPPAGLARFWFGPNLARFGRPLDATDVAAADPDGGVLLDGYVDLLRRMESAPPGAQALVTVGDPGGEPQVFLAHRGRTGVAFLDPGTGGAAVFPADRTPVRFIPLPGTMPLDDRFDALNTARFGADDPSWSIAPPAGVHEHAPEQGEPIWVVGPVGAEPRPFLDRVAVLAAGLDQPVVVLAAGRSGDTPRGERITPLHSLLERLGWQGKVPVVVTRAAMTPGNPVVVALHGLLDDYGASLAHQAPGRTAATGSGGLVSFLGNPWTVRAANAPAGAPVDDNLTPDLLDFAAGDGRRPTHAAVPEPVATFLTTPLTAGGGLDPRGLPVRTLGPLVRQIATRDPSFAGHDAALQLTGLGHGDLVTSYLGDGAGRGDRLFQPLLGVGGETGADRQQGIRALLPHLAALAGGDVQDNASYAILTALNKMLSLPAGSVDAEQFTKQIWDYKDYLPSDGRVRVEWQRRLTTLKDHVPAEYGGDIDTVATAIMTCPEPA